MNIVIMQRQWVFRRTRARGGVIAIAMVCVAVVLVLIGAERGLFTRAPAPTARGMLLPGITLNDDDDGSGADPPMPVVTSLRTNGQAERLGVRVGDRIAAIDGRPVRDIAGLRAALLMTGSRQPVALHILRGSAVWNVAIDRAEPLNAAAPAATTEKMMAHGS